MDNRADAQARFLKQVRQAIDERRLRRLLLSRPAHRVLAPGFVDEGPVLQRVVAKPVRTGDGVKLGLTWHYDTRDQNECLPASAALLRIESLLHETMQSALLDGGTVEAELGYSKRGRPLFRSRRLAQAADEAGKSGPQAADPETQPAGITAEKRQPPTGLTMLRPSGSAGSAGMQSALATGAEKPPAPGDRDDDDWLGLSEHNRKKQHLIPMDRPFLRDLGIIGPGGTVVPAMARKWKQINRFVEIVATAWQNNPLSAARGKSAPADACPEDMQPVRIRDYGAGKGYLTFALHDYLSNTLGLKVETVGIERRSDLVALCNGIARRRGMDGLRFVQGAIADEADADTAADIVIALHACDTATDDALYRGVRTQAAMLVCSPCCHKELRPQLLSPHPLRPLLRHGIHLGQEAEMLTDGLRALLLESEGYEAQVFEFIALEHTSKNKMILGNRTGKRRPKEGVLAEIDALKQFYGIGTQKLDGLLRGSRHDAGAVSDSLHRSNPASPGYGR